MLSCLAPWGAHLGHPVATDGSFLVGAGRVHSNQLASLVGCEVAQTWTCFQVNPDNTPREVIQGGRLVYKQGTNTLADPPKTGFGQQRDMLFYRPLMSSDFSWYAVDANNRILQCLCVDRIDHGGSSIAQWLISTGDLTCTCATWDGSTVVCLAAGYLRAGMAWPTEFNGWETRGIARLVKYRPLVHVVRLPVVVHLCRAYPQIYRVVHPHGEPEHHMAVLKDVNNSGFQLYITPELAAKKTAVKRLTRP